MLLETKNQDHLYYVHIHDHDLLIKIPLEKKEILFSHEKDADVTLAKTDTLPIHFKIVKNEEDQFLLDPLDSTNLFLNNKQVKEINILNKSDQFKVTGYSFDFIKKTLEEQKQESLPPVEDDGKTQFMQVMHIEEDPSKGRLVGVSGSIKGKIFEFNKDKMSVGRDPTNDICISEDGLSRAHAMIEVDDGSITVIDFNSTNGTFVKEKKITTEVVKPGSVIQFANAALKYETDQMIEQSEDKKSTNPFLLIFLMILLIAAVIFYLFIKKQNTQVTHQKIEISKLKEEISSKAHSTTDYTTAKKAYDQGQLREAMIMTDKILTKNPDHGDALILKGQIKTALKHKEMNILYKKSMNYYKANEWEKAYSSFRLINADFEHYSKIKTFMNQIEKIEDYDIIVNKSIAEYDSGNIDKALLSIQKVIKDFPEYKKPQELFLKINQIAEILNQIQNPSLKVPVKEKENKLRKILSLEMNESHFYHIFAKKQLNQISEGHFFKAEQFYALGNEELAKRNFSTAYEYYKNAFETDQNSIKFKIAYTQMKQKRKNLIAAYYLSALHMTEANPLKAKKIWKKIIEFGEMDNPQYATALKNLEN